MPKTHNHLNKKLIVNDGNRSRSASNGMTFGIIGYGRFGKLWAKALSDFGNVFIYDKNPKIKVRGSSLKQASLKQAARADIVFLLVPISRMQDICQRVCNLLLPQTIVVDACSVKLHPSAAMKRVLKKDQPILATHPLFGPDSAKRNGGLSGLKITLCPIRLSKTELRPLLNILKKMRLKILFSSPSEHDLQMARSQALVHFLGRGLAELDLKPQKIYTPDYDFLLKINDMVVNDTWELFLDMQRLNPYASSVRKKLLNSLREIDFKILSEPKSLPSLRKGMADTDKEIISLINRRFQLAKKVGDLKKSMGKEVTDLRRERWLKIFHSKLIKKYKLNNKIINSVFRLLVNHSKTLQQ